MATQTGFVVENHKKDEPAGSPRSVNSLIVLMEGKHSLLRAASGVLEQLGVCQATRPRLQVQFC